MVLRKASKQTAPELDMTKEQNMHLYAQHKKKWEELSLRGESQWYCNSTHMNKFKSLREKTDK